MNIKKLCIIVTYFFACPKLVGAPTMQLSFKPYPRIYAERMLKKIKKNGHVGKEFINSILPHKQEAGIFASYAGFLKASNDDGAIIFPLKHLGAVLHILVTPEITPVTMVENTVHHWELIPSQPAALYRLEPGQESTLKNATWQVERTDLPENGIIPKETIIIFGNPKDFEITSESLISRQSSLVMAPTILVKEDMQASTKNDIYVLHLRHFFAEPDSAYKVQFNRYETTVAP